MFYKLDEQGFAPQTHNAGAKRLISDEADAAWLRAREAVQEITGAYKCENAARFGAASIFTGIQKLGKQMNTRSTPEVQAGIHAKNFPTQKPVCRSTLPTSASFCNRP